MSSGKVRSTVAATLLAFGAAGASAQESYVSNDPFDPFVGVMTPISEENFSQSGTKVAPEVSLNLSTFRMRSSGQVQQYLKVQLSYVLAPHLGISDPIAVHSAHYEGGHEADFQVVDMSENCVPSGLCKVTEVLSVRFPFSSYEGGPIRIQLRNRTGSWRGTATVPGTLFGHNEEQLKHVK